MSLMLLELKGAPLERGRTHGEAMVSSVRANLEIYLRRFEASGMDRETAAQEGARWAEVIRRTNEDYFFEMQGVAEGTGLSLPEIALLNARYEIAFTLYGKDARAFDEPATATEDGCTTFGIRGDKTAGHKTLLGQNWDWLDAITPHTLLTKVRSANKPALLCLTEAGIIGGKMGLNEAGIGLVENGLASSLDGRNPYQNHLHVRCREILEADAFDRAMLSVIRTKRTASANFLIGHADGEIVGLESSPDHVSYYYPTDDVVTHSNHFTMPGHGRSEMERIGPSTIIRAKRAERLIRAFGRSVDVPSLMTVMMDHFCHPNGLCRHPDVRLPEVRRTATLATVVLDLTDRVMHVTHGRPCESAFVSYAL